MKLFANFKHDFEQFASKNLDKIEKNMELRQDFNQLCQDLNIDALSSSSSIFSKLVRDYYNRLAIKLLSYFELQKCSHIVVNDYLAEFNKKQPKQNHINKKDLEQAIKIMNQLSPGFKMVKQAGTDLIVFMDAEQEQLHNNVQNVINQCLQANRDVLNLKTVKQLLSCTDSVAKQTIDSMVNQRIVAVDNQGTGGWQDPDYYIVSVFGYAKH